MNRADITTILADIDDTMLRVRDLSSSPVRAAALQCLADARRHLEHAAGFFGIQRNELLSVRGCRLPSNASVMAIKTDDYAFRAGDSVPSSAAEGFTVRVGYDCRTDPAFAAPGNLSVPPSATDNQRAPFPPTGVGPNSYPSEFYATDRRRGYRLPSGYPSARDIQRTIAHASGRGDLAPSEAPRPIQTSPFRHVALESVPPSVAANQPARNKANEAFRKARELLSGITLRGIAEREHEKLLDEQAEGRK